MSSSRPDSVADPFITAPNTPLQEHGHLEPPRASYLASDPVSELSTPHESYGHSPGNSTALLPEAEKQEERRAYAERQHAGFPKRSIFKRPLFWLASLVALAIVVLAVVLPVYFTVVKPRQNKQAYSSGGGGSPGNPESPTGATTGGNGSLVVTSDGSSFTYINPFGGYWVYNSNDPFNNGARPNSWTPALNSTWIWGVDRINGVNLGGLFVLEPFIAPALFQKYPGAVDEWTLSTLMAADTAGGGLNQLEDHYNTFITEQDIAQIAGAGLNWIRLPIPFWAIDKWDFEPFLEKVCWPYILRVLQWARKYGLRVNLDLHTIPGSQNGYNHSGKLGSVNFLNGVMGLANAERALNYIRIITEFISQPEWQNVVPIFSIVNEALVSTIGKDEITTFYLEAYDMIRNITGEGAGNGPYIAIHDGFLGVSNWAGFLSGSDRIMLDTHPYFAFDGQANTQPIATGTGINAGGIWPKQACNAWGPGMNTSQTAFGVTFAGEFSNGFNDCGLYLTGVGNTASYTGSCTQFMDASQFNDTMKAGLQEFTLASMDALQNYFFWTWKIGNSSTTNSVQSPLWSYQLGLEQGWMPANPRDAVGSCAALGVSENQFDGTYSPYQTGGAGAGTIDPASISSYGQYPPSTLSGLTSGAVMSLLPTYTSTGTVVTLPPLTFSPKPTPSVSVGNGWHDSADTGAGPTEVQGCTYPNAWSAVSAAMPTALCPATGVAAPVITPAPTSTPALR
ncbi:glycoside hydrolase family 5 protein [Serpula lacrymans var. lacrymans S7.3]|uniref:glucan 1,3-beta-glucosidase n=2 Tax=Serpula lacrymans var. lacrymans TaxID=341189 RepID=F8QIR2_SERL3|nr:glycoside hydrolase family 5 protein [Serpula lacrymans var. lacrymans S7.9]EGN91810.1 glycoside hydrolase family 5 protein [Serpula lacrymans var. lacrymans S7.3]EGO26066.1 glycoside hydrolase family 5 protein [Serpula lacrymans var. lacrymans S7.9]